MPTQEEFDRTAETIKYLASKMSDIHEAYPDPKDKKLKEQNKFYREKLLQPYRDCCKILQHERIRFNREG